MSHDKGFAQKFAPHHRQLFGFHQRLLRQLVHVESSLPVQRWIHLHRFLLIRLRSHLDVFRFHVECLRVGFYRHEQQGHRQKFLQLAYSVTFYDAFMFVHLWSHGKYSPCQASVNTCALKLALQSWPSLTSKRQRTILIPDLREEHMPNQDNRKTWPHTK